MTDDDLGNKNRRRYSRIPFVDNVTLQDTTGTTTWPCLLIDVSLAGALLECPANFSAKQDQTFTLTIKLDGEAIVINMLVNVAHQQQKRIGFLCQQIDADSITHLRRLVELNLGDAELVRRELGQLANKFGS